MNKAIVITNEGMIDPLAFELIGASSKRSDESTIGFFGSGLKYAIAGLLRRGIDFQIWCGEEALDITTKEVTMRGQTFNRIFFNGEPTSLTTDMGPRWDKWMLIRELYANAIDEGGEMAVTEGYEQFIKQGRTTIIFPSPDQLEDVMKDQDILFCRDREIEYSDERITIYEEVGDGGFYVKGILVGRQLKGFGYQLNASPYPLNEERALADNFNGVSDTVQSIMQISDRKMVKRFVSRAKTKETLENYLVMSYMSDCRASDEWSDIVLFKKNSADFATEWNHLVVSDYVYDNLENVKKWEDKRWIKVGSNAQTLNLRKAVEFAKAKMPGIIPSCEWYFGRSDSRSIGMGIEDDKAYMSDELINEPLHVLAAHIVLYTGKDGGALNVLKAYMYNESNTLIK